MKIIQKNRELIAYLFFGVLTTLVNYLVYFFSKDTFHWDYRLANGVAWFFSVLFAFFTNKFWVFQSHTLAWQKFFKEFLLFYWYRILSLVIDMGLMIVLIDTFRWTDFWAKTCTQILVILANYLFSKLFIFKK